jgi:hypothetical protein
VAENLTASSSRPARAHRWFLGGLKWEFASESPIHEVLNPRKTPKIILKWELVEIALDPADREALHFSPTPTFLFFGPLLRGRAVNEEPAKVYDAVAVL